MQSLRESRSRGTPDLPFSRYHMSNKPVSAMFAHIHWHPELEILYMQRGSVELLTGSNYITLCPGDIAFVPPNQLHSIRIDKAAALLRNQSMSISQAALQCGFENHGFFSRKFKQILGISPKAYSIYHRKK